MGNQQPGGVSGAGGNTGSNTGGGGGGTGESHQHRHHQQQQGHPGSGSGSSTNSRGYTSGVYSQQQQYQQQQQPPAYSNQIPSAQPNQVIGHQQQQQPHGGGSYNPTVIASGYMSNDMNQQQQQHQHPDVLAMQRSSSDTSMTIMDNNALAGMMNENSSVKVGGGGGVGGVSSSNNSIPAAVFDNWLDDTVPTVFRWEHGGRQVYITGTFNGWSRQIPMHRSGNDFTYIHNLKRGKHAFKFIVDDEWRFAPDQPTVADIEGRINNFIDVTSFKPYTGDKDFEKEKAAAEYGVYGAAAVNSVSDDAEFSDAGAGSDAPRSTSTNALGVGGSGSGVGIGMAGSGSNRPDRDGEIFTTTLPDMDEYTKEPPPLPPHLRHIILNKPPQRCDTAALPVPQHVALNHLYCTAIKDNMMVLGITQRYKTKFVTTVYYSPCGK